MVSGVNWLKYQVILGGGILLMLGTYAVQAQTAFVTGSVNLRQGPGTQYARIAALPRGVSVHIDMCRAGWCHVRTSWGLGWVSGRYLAHGYPSRAYPRRQNNVYFGFDIFPDYRYDEPCYHRRCRPDYWPGYRPVPPGYNPYRPSYVPGSGVSPARPPYVPGSGVSPDRPPYVPGSGVQPAQPGYNPYRTSDAPASRVSPAWNPRWGVGPVRPPAGAVKR